MRPGVQCILRLLFASAWGEKQTPGQTRADVDEVDDDDEDGADAYSFRQTQQAPTLFDACRRPQSFLRKVRAFFALAGGNCYFEPLPELNSKHDRQRATHAAKQT